MINIKLLHLAKSYWQSIIIAILALILSIQLISWSCIALQMHKIDELITTSKFKKTTKSNYSIDLEYLESLYLQPEQNIFLARIPNYTLTAIYKNEAIINGLIVKIGDKIGKATIEKILLSSVITHEDGKEPQEIKMFQGDGSYY